MLRGPFKSLYLLSVSSQSVDWKNKEETVYKETSNLQVFFYPDGFFINLWFCAIMIFMPIRSNLQIYYEQAEIE